MEVDGESNSGAREKTHILLCIRTQHFNSWGELRLQMNASHVTRHTQAHLHGGKSR